MSPKRIFPRNLLYEDIAGCKSYRNFPHVSLE